MYTGISCDSSETSVTDNDTMCVHSGTCEMFVPGDANGDGLCNAADVLYLVSYLKLLVEIPYPLFRGDVNCNKAVEGGDVTYLRNYFKLTGPAPKCCYWLSQDTLVTYYIYSGNQVIAEYDKSGQLIYNYLYLGMNRLARFDGFAKEYYVNDIRGSVVGILAYNGDVLSSFEYEPFGTIYSQSGNAADFQYTGKEFDEGYDFDLYYYGARYYNAALGRFITPDPVREYLNPYSYVGNEPVMLVDRDGKAISDWIFDVIIEGWDASFGAEDAGDPWESDYLSPRYGRPWLVPGPECCNGPEPDMGAVPHFGNSPQPDVTGYWGGH